MEHTIVVPTGYMGSGSSAVTDLVSEIDGFDANYGEFEYVFLHCPDGLFDLEDKLLVGNNYIRSDEAIHRFLDCMKDLYAKKNYWPSGYREKISKDFPRYCREFIDEIKCAEFDDGHWYYTQNPTLWMSAFGYFRYVLWIATGKKILLQRPNRYKGMYLAYPAAEEFYPAARRFLRKIFTAMGIENKNLVLDQLLLPHNLTRIDQYFDESLRVFVVERDPRDVFILNKYYWKRQGQTVPYPMDAEKFCQVYRAGRERERPAEDSRIMRLYFEDLIYRYERTLPAVYEFLGVDGKSHSWKKTIFNPDISIHNTQLFAKNENYKAESDYIAANLGEYLYDFPAGFSVPRNDKIVF